MTIPIRERHVESGADPEEMVNFTRVSSEFYPKLAAYYEQEAQEWLDKRLEEARIEGVGEEELEEFQEQRRRAIENAPPMAPTDFASHMRVRDLDDIGLAALQKWLREVKNIKDATVLKRPPKIKFDCMARGEQFWLEIKWSDGSETNCLDFRPETLVQEAFSAF